MKNLTFIGIILFGIGGLLFYMNNMAIDLRVIYGILCGIGIGLIIGGIVGYLSKGSAIKDQQKKQAFKQLQKEKEEFEKQQILAAAEQKRQEALRQDENKNLNL